MPVAATPPVVRVRVPAKVNLHLGVGGLRADGFHDLMNVFQAVDLMDEIRATASLGLQIRMSGVGAQTLPTGPDNLAWRAASLLADHAQVAPDVLLEIDKAIPVAGGMAGGSADAAGTLVACAALWHTGTTKPELLELAAELGSDVAFPLVGGTALGTGRGEVLTPALSTGSFHWVFAMADFGISAAAAYGELDRQRGPTRDAPAAPDAVLDALRSGSAHRLAAVLSNDLQDAALALQPVLDETLQLGAELGALAGIVSGSGPTIAFLTDGAAGAARLAAELRSAAICSEIHVATGPVPGARIVV